MASLFNSSSTKVSGWPGSLGKSRALSCLAVTFSSTKISCFNWAMVMPGSTDRPNCTPSSVSNRRLIFSAFDGGTTIKKKLRFHCEFSSFIIIKVSRDISRI